MQEQDKLPVTEGALVRRVNRALRRENKFHRLKKTRGWRLKQNLGNYYVIDDYRNVIVNHHVDIEHLAARLDVLSDREGLGSPETTFTTPAY